MPRTRRSPPRAGEPASPASPAATLAQRLRQHPGQSGVRLISDGAEALAVRALGARRASQGIDVQYYIWHDDVTGRMLGRELVAAADRGVNVRVLLDDMDARPKDVVLAALDHHPRIDVRMFNPFRTRSGTLHTAAELLKRGSRLNHRMHNKAWIIDGAVAIVGGRNIGDEYFAADGEVNFVDLDVLMVGPAVGDTTQQFERYWACALSVPISRLRKFSRGRPARTKTWRDLEASTASAERSEHARGLGRQGEIARLLEADAELVWSADVQVVADDPRKAQGQRSGLAPGVLDRMVNEIRAAGREVLLTSSYFVPGIGGTAMLRSLALQSGRVAVLTNSLAATDVAAVHSGYARYRRPLLEAGVRLFELMPSPATNEGRGRFGLGSSRSSLHTKAAVIDRERVFVGSYNIDPRSALINCEMGVWIRSARLATELRRAFEFGTAGERSFAVTLDRDGALLWLESHGDTELRHRTEPYAGWTRRAVVRLLSYLPIEAQL